MTDKFDLSRRKLLGAMGTIGGAAALGGASTMAFFSDTEEFANNQLVAGELDLLVDWTEHYSDWMGSETDVTVSMTDPNDPSYTPVPTADFPVLWVQDKTLFQEATSIESFPDTDTNGTADDGIQDTIPSDDECDYINQFLREGDEWISPLDSSARTSGTVEGQTTTAGDPLINLQDVKPGDFGEVTFSLHLCDNPGYIWMSGALDQELTSENGLTEPEAADEDEEDGVVELLNELRAAVWYDYGTDVDGDGYPWEGPYSTDPDEGDNVQQSGEPNLIGQGSLGAILDALNTSDLGVPLDAIPGSGSSSVQIPPVGPSDGSDPGNTDFESTRYEKPQQGIVDCAAIDSDLVSVRKIDAPDLPVDGDVQTYGTPSGEIAIQGFGNDNGQPYRIAFDSEFSVAGVLIKGGQDSLGWTPVGQDYSSGTTGFAYNFANPPWNPGSDTGDDPGDDPGDVQLGAPTNAGGQVASISNVQFCIEPNGDDDDNGDDDNGGGGQQNGDRDCFEASTTVSIGLAWWLPVDHANEIQTDTVAFDLSFYTEQCRHNDGSGMANRNG